jgi:alkylated DNA repair protein (DNA oxidative demethylase)
MTLEMFPDAPEEAPGDQPLSPGAVLLRGFALPESASILEALRDIEEAAPYRHLVTPGGHEMSVAMMNCGPVGWVSGASGYRYAARDPATGRPWPPMPRVFRELAVAAAARAGFADYRPDACLINRYDPGARLSLHQDRNGDDVLAPVVTVSLGLPATFLFGTPTRSGPVQRQAVRHGDVVVWGGPSRMAFHGVAPLPDGLHAALGRRRVSLAFRQVRRAGRPADEG